MAGTYKGYMKLLETWPLDKSKAGRDLGQHIRDQLKIAFSHGEATTQIDLDKCNRYYSSINRIASNHYGQIYPRILSSTATGLSREECNMILLPESLEMFEAQNAGFFTRVFRHTLSFFSYLRNKA